MGKSLTKGTIVGAIIIFVWMMISWMLLPWHCTAMNSFKDEKAVSSVIVENTTVDGIYVLPNICDASNMQEHSIAMKQGPVVFAAVQRHGFDVDSVTPYILSFIIQLIGAFLVTYLLLLSKAAGYWKGVWFITILGLTIGVIGALPNWNWWGYSFAYVGIEILDLIVGWFLAGLVISAVAKRA